MTLQTKTFKELNTMTEEVAYRFFMAKRILAALRKGEMVSENDTPYQIYLQRVECAYCLLDEKEKNLINNEFFFQNYQYWWVGLYSKTVFYRLKKRTMLKFLEGVYHV